MNITVPPYEHLLETSNPFMSSLVYAGLKDVLTYAAGVSTPILKRLQRNPLLF